jgi:hypothetical protein
MKKTNVMALLMFFALGVSPVFGANSESGNSSKSVETTNEMELTNAEMNTLTARVVEIRDMDKSDMSASEKSELKSELKEIKQTMQSSAPYIYIGGSTLILLIILLIILL